MKMPLAEMEYVNGSSHVDSQVVQPRSRGSEWRLSNPQVSYLIKLLDNGSIDNGVV